MRIYFHGTNKESANKILKNGFKKGTWFADHLEDALEFGGNHIFQVVIDVIGKRSYNWQVCIINKINKDRIVKYEIHKTKVIQENKKLRDKIFELNQD